MPYSAGALGQGLRLRSRRVRSDRPQGTTVKVAAIAAVLAALIGFLSSSLRVEALPWLTTAPAEETLPAPRPLALEEQRYTDALWSIHAQVEQTVARVGLGAAFYQSGEIDRPELKLRLNIGLAGYRLAESQLQALDPPSNLRPSHEAYLSAIHLFQQSTLEMLKMYDDDNEEHLTTALPLSLDGTSKLREIGVQFWPETYPQG